MNHSPAARLLPLTALVWALFLVVPSSEAGFCQCCGSSPLILDLDHDGRVRTMGLNFGVLFDINGDGVPERMGWTYPQTPEAFLWRDLNGNGAVDNGHELFGNSTFLPDGAVARNGFEALAVLDRAEQGGNKDGWITPEDRDWQHLRLWIDRSHDGISQPEEIYRLEDWGVIGIGLEYVEDRRRGGNGNDHRFQGNFLREVEALGRRFLRKQLIEDVFFVTE
jgi:hypothetical protein